MHTATTPRSRLLPLRSPRPHLPHYEKHAPFPRPRAPPMADCFAAADVDDLHRRWLPREIFADIGIADAAPPSAAAAVEDVAVHLTGILGGKAGPPRRPPPPPAPTPRRRQHHYHHQAAQVCGQQGAVLVAYGGGCNGGGAPAAWPYPPLQWQATTNFANGGGVPGPMHAPSRPFHGPPPAKRRLGGTGVFLPRAQVYQYQHRAANMSPAKDGKPPKEMQQRQRQRGGDEEATETTQRQQNASAALLALPQEWTY